MPVIYLLLIALLAACGSKNPYACTADSQCVRGGTQGVCSMDHCAFPDPACEGGYRFEDNAGSLANTCTVSLIDAPPPDVLVEGSHCIADIAIGRRHMCVLRTNGTVWCSGENVYGQLGFGLAGVPSATLMQVRDTSTNVITDATAIGAGREHTCVVRAGGSLWCWGRNNGGQLGDGTSNQAAAAVRVIDVANNPLMGVAEVKAGYNHTCARLDSGQVHCWGTNGQNELGDGTMTGRAKAGPVLVAMAGAPFTGAVDLQIGGGHGCVRKANDEMWCWGKNNDGEAGDNTNVHKPVPVRSGDAKMIATLLWSTCRVNADTSMSCHGWNRGAGFGVGVDEGFMQAANYLVPTKSLVAPGGSPVTGISKIAGGSGMCAIMTDSSVRCSGDGQYGQNGTGAPRRVLTPVKHRDGSPLTGVDRLVAKWPHVCAHLTNGTWECWGRGSLGEFGDGTFENRAFPAPLGGSCP